MYDIECDMDGIGCPDSYDKYYPPGITIHSHSLPLQNSKNGNQASTSIIRDKAPKLKRLILQPTSVEFIKQMSNGLEEGGPCGVFQVRIEKEDRILKIFRGVKNKPGTRGFLREVRAYQNLVDGKSCTAGIVPCCFGWTSITLNDWAFSDGKDWLYRFREDEEEARALVLEYIPDATRLSLRNITPQVINNALDAMTLIHDDGILHGDLHPRNILVLPADRVVWIDFDVASTLPWHQNIVHRGSLSREWKYAWSLFYCAMLPWKCYTLRQSKVRGELQDCCALDLVEQALLDNGAKFDDFV